MKECENTVVLELEKKLADVEVQQLTNIEEKYAKKQFKPEGIGYILTSLKPGIEIKDYFSQGE